MEDKIQKHISKLNLDIRKTNNARYFDQKGKIDVVSFLAESVLELIKDNKDKKFSNKDIWGMEWFEQNVPELFNKPQPSDPGASNEYDKFVGQPLLVLLYSGILKGKKNGSWKYQCNNEEILEYLTRSPRNAHEFLAKYYEKVLRDSGLGNHLDEFLQKQNQQSLENLRDEFYNLLYNNTPIGDRCASGDNPGKTEAMRIFNPVLNVICSKHRKEGTESGRVSEHVIRYDELQYNRINFRDEFKNKEITRKQAEKITKIEKSSEKFYARQEVKARKIMKEKYENEPMFLDEFHKCTNPEVHHIILKSNKIQFRGYPENLINLSPTQHSNLAHGHGKGISTKQADPTYQRKLLIANSFYIENSIKKGELIYSKDQFVEILTEGLELDIDENDSFDVIRKKVADDFLDSNEIKEIRKMIIDFS